MMNYDHKINHDYNSVQLAIHQQNPHATLNSQIYLETTAIYETIRIDAENKVEIILYVTYQVDRSIKRKRTIALIS